MLQVVVIILFSYLDSNKKYIVALKKGVELIKKKDGKSKAEGVKYLEKATQYFVSYLILYRLEPSKPKAWCILGKYYQGQRELKKSLTPLSKCSSIDPTADNRLTYGISLFDYGNVDIAKEMFIVHWFID